MRAAISRHRILEKIGEGGTGAVSKAKAFHLGSFVALKVPPRKRVANASCKVRPFRVAGAASALKPPNIVTVHDIDQLDGLDFILMEYVPGKTLTEIIFRKDMKLSDALKYGVQIADALSRPQTAGVVLKY